MAALGVGWVTLIRMLVDPQHPDLSADSTQEMANARTEGVELAGFALEPPVCDPRGLESPAPNLDPSFDCSARSDGKQDPTATVARVCPTLGDLFASMATDVESEAFVGNALSRLEERLWSHDAEVQKDALEILANAARLGDEQALATLHNTLDANDHVLRRRAVRALAKTETSGFTADLVNLANDPNAGVRAQVARSLGELPAELSGDLLVSMLHDPSDKVVEKALQGLGDLRYAPAHMGIARCSERATPMSRQRLAVPCAGSAIP